MTDSTDTPPSLRVVILDDYQKTVLTPHLGYVTAETHPLRSRIPGTQVFVLRDRWARNWRWGFDGHGLRQLTA